MSLKDSLTPKNTEEVKPGLFVQNKNGTWRAVQPIVWNGEWRLKNQFGWKNLFTILLIFLIAYSYFHETSYCRELQENPCEILTNLTNYCFEVGQDSIGINYGEQKKDNIALQDYP